MKTPFLLFDKACGPRRLEYFHISKFEFLIQWEDVHFWLVYLRQIVIGEKGQYFKENIEILNYIIIWYSSEPLLHILKQFSQSVLSLHSNKKNELTLTEHFKNIRNIQVDYFDNPVCAKV